MTAHLPSETYVSVCLGHLGRFPSQMSASCNWAKQPRDCMIMDKTHKVKSCSCMVPRSNVSLVHLGHTAT